MNDQKIEMSKKETEPSSMIEGIGGEVSAIQSP